MKMKCFLAALPLIISLAMSAAAQARTNESPAPTPGYEIGREVAAPPWSAACMTDHGPSQCDEPMWAYGSSRALSRYKDAFCLRPANLTMRQIASRHRADQSPGAREPFGFPQVSNRAMVSRQIAQCCRGKAGQLNFARSGD